MNKLNINTNGEKIEVEYAQLRTHPKIGCEMAYLDLKIGDLLISINFDTWEEMIQFCEDHNFKYDDERG